MWPNKRHASAHLEAIYKQRVSDVFGSLMRKHSNTNHKILCEIHIVNIGWECGRQKGIKFEAAENFPIRTGDNVA